jgi:flagellar basal body-associated protein FliL
MPVIPRNRRNNMDLIIIALVILIVSLGIFMVYVIRTKHTQAEEINPRKNWMWIGIGMGMGIGMPIGLVLGILMENAPIGVLLGLIFGGGIGTAIGAFIEKKRGEDQEEPLSEQEKKYFKIASITGLVLFSIGLVLLTIAIIR